MLLANILTSPLEATVKISERDQINNTAQDTRELFVSLQVFEALNAHQMYFAAPKIDGERFAARHHFSSLALRDLVKFRSNHQDGNRKWHRLFHDV